MNVSVFITGESGTGKEILARAVHHFSDRAAKPFIPFNCTAVPRDMLESQLFGHRRGSFTGADRDHAGMIGAARDPVPRRKRRAPPAAEAAPLLGVERSLLARRIDALPRQPHR